jgi:mono/diheme cytochrome c family protein
MLVLLLLVVIGTWIPLGMIYHARTTKSEKPRVHLFFDMDQQPKLGPQASFSGFVDGRAMRQPVAGTIARGRLQHDDLLYAGIIRDPANPDGPFAFAEEFPQQVTIDQKLVSRGQQQFAIYCAICHGEDGLGNGPVNARAVELKEAKWVPATNLMTQEIRDRKDGQLVQAIRDGVRNMPSYKSQISAHDRWAIVAWLRQLQANSAVAPPETKQ